MIAVAYHATPTSLGQIASIYTLYIYVCVKQMMELSKCITACRGQAVQKQNLKKITAANLARVGLENDDQLIATIE